MAGGNRQRGESQNNHQAFGHGRLEFDAFR
jgi:hypothetical protein